MQGTVEPILSFLVKKRTEPRFPFFKWAGTLSGVVSFFFCNYVALPWHTDVRVNLHVSSAANNGFQESDVIMGMPSWALQYILALLFSTANLCFSSAFIWRCEDDPAIIEKYGNHKFDFVSDDIRDKMIAYDEAQGNLTLRDLADSMTAEKMLESTDSDNPVFDGDGLTDLDEGMPVDEDRELFLRFDPSSKNAAWFREKFETAEAWKKDPENQAPGKDVLEAYKAFEDEYVKKSKGEIPASQIGLWQSTRVELKHDEGVCVPAKRPT